MTEPLGETHKNWPGPGFSHFFLGKIEGNSWKSNRKTNKIYEKTRHIEENLFEKGLIYYSILSYSKKGCTLFLLWFDRSTVSSIIQHTIPSWACPFLPLLSPDIGKRLKTLEIKGRTAKNRRPRRKFLGFHIFYCDFLYFPIFCSAFGAIDAQVCGKAHWWKQKTKKAEKNKKIIKNNKQNKKTKNNKKHNNNKKTKKKKQQQTKQKNKKNKQTNHKNKTKNTKQQKKQNNKTQKKLMHRSVSCEGKAFFCIFVVGFFDFRLVFLGFLPGEDAESDPLIRTLSKTNPSCPPKTCSFTK